jgi:hypothetical protein
MTRGSRTVIALATLALLGMPLGAALAQAPASSGSARGIYLAGSTLGVSTEIEFERNGQRGMVPPTFEFKSGDKFWLHITTNRAAYIYVLNRTVKGNPETAASRGIKLMQNDDVKNPDPDAYTMVYPAPGANPPLVKANTVTRIPRDDNQFFTMDEIVGAEKVMIVAADKPSDIDSSFDKKTGKMARRAGTADSASAVLNRLNGELSRLADNSVTEETPRSRDIKIRPLPTAPPVQAGEPARPGSVPPAPKPDPPRADAKGPGIVPGAGNPPINTATVGKTPGPLLQELTLVHLAR